MLEQPRFEKSPVDFRNMAEVDGGEFSMEQRSGPEPAAEPKFSPHWTQVVLAVLLLATLVGLVLHAVDARVDEAEVNASVAELESNSGALIEVQTLSLDLYDAVDAWKEGGPFPPVGVAVRQLDDRIASTEPVGLSTPELLGDAYTNSLDALRQVLSTPVPDPEVAYDAAEPFERAAVALSRKYEELLDPGSRVEILGATHNEERGMRLVMLVILLGGALGTVTVLRSRSQYRSAKSRFDRDRAELDRASVLERGEAEILAGIVAGDDIGALTLSVLDLAHRLTGGCLRFVKAPDLDVEGLPPALFCSYGSSIGAGSEGVPTPEADAQLPVSAGVGMELGVLELRMLDRPGPVDERSIDVVRRCADLIALVVDRALAEAQLRHRATHDALTGMPNRSHLLDLVAHGLAQRAKSPDHEVALVFCDLDRFKLVNDTLGHRTGDELLRAVGRRLSASVNDTGTVLTRLGGDEFVAVCTGPDAAVRAAAQAEDLAASLQTRFLVGGVELHVSASFGIAVADESTDSPEQLLRNADMAMYAAKRDSLVTVVRYDAELEAGLAALLETDVALRAALANDGLVVHFQPLFDIERSMPVGVEALVRWERDGVLVPPGDFLPVARSNGLMGEVCRTVTAQSLDALQSVHGLLPDLSLWLNVESQQLRDPRFPAGLAAELERTGVPPTNLVLEISEADFLTVDEIGGVIQTLRDMGVRLAMDDFGTGYSSIVRLTELPIDIVKLDRALVAGASPAADRASGILAASVALVSSANLDVVVEGVETEAELDAVRQLGCGVVQGYLLRRPGPAAEVLAECVSSAGLPTT